MRLPERGTDGVAEPSRGGSRDRRSWRRGGWHRLDLLVAGVLVVELKAVKTLEDVPFAVVRSYLKASGRKHGLILNFAKPTLSVKRVIASLPPHQDLLVSRLP